MSPVPSSQWLATPPRTALYSGYPDVSTSPSSRAQTNVSKARSIASIDSRTTSAWRVIGEWMWWALSHCIASDGRTIVGVAWLNSIARGSTTSISLLARPASIEGSSSNARGPALNRTPSLLLPA